VYFPSFLDYGFIIHSSGLPSTHGCDHPYMYQVLLQVEEVGFQARGQRGKLLGP
jgi:hypothetical protein